MERSLVLPLSLALFAACSGTDTAGSPGSLSQAGGGNGCPQVACPPGQLCNVQTGNCYAAPPASCNDHVKNGTESDVDCGGACPKCAVGRACRVNVDCTITSCVNNICQATHCVDGVLSGTESDVDCGGSNCPDRCADGRLCNNNSDCNNMNCVPSGNCAHCDLASCHDGIQNNNEMGIDCGGNCPGCNSGQNCNNTCDCNDLCCTSREGERIECEKFELHSQCINNACTCVW